jgi:hypothetical protein
MEGKSSLNQQQKGLSVKGNRGSEYPQGSDFALADN